MDNPNNAQNELQSNSLFDDEIIAEKLKQPLDVSHIKSRQAFGGKGWRVIDLANEIFGYNGWSSQIIKTEKIESQQKTFSVGISTTVRVTLKDGTFHEDVGYGTADNQKSLGQALEKARKEAATDAVKRTLRMFGSSLGNCLYDKSFLNNLGRQNINNQLATKNYNKTTETIKITDNINSKTKVAKYEENTNSISGSTITNKTLISNYQQENNYRYKNNTAITVNSEGGFNTAKNCIFNNKNLDGLYNYNQYKLPTNTNHVDNNKTTNNNLYLNTNSKNI